MDRSRWLDSRPEAGVRQIRRLAGDLLEGEGDSSAELRQGVIDRAAVLAGGGSPEPPEIPRVWRTYVDKVALHAYKVLDEDVETLKLEGYSEGEIFEVTLAAGLGASLGRLELAFELLDREKE